MLFLFLLRLRTHTHFSAHTLTSLTCGLRQVPDASLDQLIFLFFPTALPFFFTAAHTHTLDTCAGLPQVPGAMASLNQLIFQAGGHAAKPEPQLNEASTFKQLEEAAYRAKVSQSVSTIIILVVSVSQSVSQWSVVVKVFKQLDEAAYRAKARPSSILFLCLCSLFFVAACADADSPRRAPHFPLTILFSPAPSSGLNANTRSFIPSQSFLSRTPAFLSRTFLSRLRLQRQDAPDGGGPARNPKT